MTTTAAGALTIECAKPGCHWKGPPSEAQNHPCPTPAPDATNAEKAAAAAERGAKIPQTSGSFLDEPAQASDVSTKALPETSPQVEAPKPEASSVHENGFGDAPAGKFAQERADLEQRLTAAGVEYSKDLGLEDLRGLAALLVDEPGASISSPSVPDPEPALGDSVAGPAVTGEPPAYDSEPETVEQLGAWLAAHGRYDRNGAPDDERTLALDTRYGALVQAQHAAAVSDEPAVDIQPADSEPRPWQTVIAEALDEQPLAVGAGAKWLVVAIHTDSQPAQLLGSGKTKNEATILREDAVARGPIQGEIVVVKTRDVLDAAEGLRMIATAEDETPEQFDHEGALDMLTDVVAATIDQGLREKGQPALFDVGDYDDPSLALPGVDGRGIERIAVAFTGEVMLDRGDKDDVALFKRLKLGQTIELWIEARGLGFAAKGATNKDGELDVVVAKRTLTVQHLRVLGPEDLKEAALEVASQARDAAENQDARDRKPEEA